LLGLPVGDVGLADGDGEREPDRDGEADADGDRPPGACRPGPP
jgi:hypothetical protein